MYWYQCATATRETNVFLMAAEVRRAACSCIAGLEESCSGSVIEGHPEIIALIISDCVKS